jgi:cytochrome c oxidase subunit 2
MERLLALPPQASAHAAEVDQMIVLLHWVMAVLFVIWAVFFIYTLVRFRQGANPKADYTGVTSHTSSYLEIAVAVVEAVLLVGFAIPAWATRVNAFPSDAESTVVRVVGKQFEWHAQYPGPDGRFGRTRNDLITPTNGIGLDRSDPNGKDDITTVNELNLPLGRPVLVRLSTQDVIHSFSIVQMRVKQDAIPGMEIPVWWEPTVAGNYEINCSQLCGLGHYRMRSAVTIMQPNEFQDWLDKEGTALQPAN